jgi:hypothetical protein
VDGYLKQSTAAQTRTIGPFVDDVDFKTLENTLTIANTDILIKKNGAASAAKNSGGATADGSGGLYAVTWDATDTSAVGQLSYSVKVAGALVAFGTYTVLEEAIYDALFVASANALASLQQEATDALETTIADSIPADGTRPTVKQALYILTQFMLERAVSGTTVTVKKADGSTTLFTLTLNDGTTPTSITRAT